MVFNSLEGKPKQRGNDPLRHGWGGDKKRREKILRERELENRERLLYPEKYGDDEEHTKFENDKGFGDKD